MAKHFKEIADELERGGGHVSGVVRLSEEARDARSARRRLDMEEDDELLGAVSRLQTLIAEQKASNERIAKQMNDMVYTMREILDEIARIKDESESRERNAQQMALYGVNKAQKDAEDVTIRNINEVTEKSKEYIGAMVQESKKRIERLAMITLPDRLFYFGKWVALMLALIILCHAVWQMLA